MAEQADAQDLKSCVRKGVWVQVPPSPPYLFKEELVMEFLKESTELCPYCKQPLKESEHQFYCYTEGCGRTFEKYKIVERD